LQIWTEQVNPTGSWSSVRTNVSKQEINRMGGILTVDNVEVEKHKDKV